MAASNTLPVHLNPLLDSESDDTDSTTSFEISEILEIPPEKILTEQADRKGQTWCLVKWENCSILRSSWERTDAFSESSRLVEAWRLEKERQKAGESQPFDVEAFYTAVKRLQEAKRERIRLGRLKRKIQRVLSIVSD